MPAPQPVTREIGARASAAARLDQQLICLRNRDDSYGMQCSHDGRVLITLAALQAFVEQGVPMDSDRLRNAHAWLLRYSADCQSVDSALVRAIAAAAVGALQYEERDADISRLKELIHTIAYELPRRRVAAFLLASECLFILNAADATILPVVRQYTSTILESATAGPAELAYAIQLASSHNLADSSLLSRAARFIETHYDTSAKLWHGCYTETAYTIIDLSYVSDRDLIPQSLRQKLIAASDELAQAALHGLDPRRMHSVPEEVGTSEVDRSLYARALIIRAIMRSAVFFGESNVFMLKFAHAYLRDTCAHVDSLRIRLLYTPMVAGIAGLACGASLAIGMARGWSYLNGTISALAGLVTLESWVRPFWQRKRQQ